MLLQRHLILRADRVEKCECFAIATKERVLPVIDALASFPISKCCCATAQSRRLFDDDHASAGGGEPYGSSETRKSRADDDGISAIGNDHFNESSTTRRARDLPDAGAARESRW